MNHQLLQAFNAYRRGHEINDSVFFPRSQPLWHRVALADTAGATPGRLEFFTTARAANITNMPRAGSLPAEYCFDLKRIGIFIEPGFDIAGAAVATHTTWAEGAADYPQASDNPGEVSEALRKLYMTGTVRVEVGNRVIVDDVFGVHNFPWGPEPRMVSTENRWTQSAAANMSIRHAQMCNGTGSADDGYFVSDGLAGVPILPDKEIKFSINWSPLPIDNLAALVVRVGLFGTLFSATNV